MIAYWEGLAAGHAGDAATAYEAAPQLARSRGVPYRPASELALGSIDELLRRVEMVAEVRNPARQDVEAAAVLGAFDQPSVTVSQALEEFFRFSEIERQSGKSERQIKRWRQPR